MLVESSASKSDRMREPTRLEFERPLSGDLPRPGEGQLWVGGRPTPFRSHRQKAVGRIGWRYSRHSGKPGIGQ